MSVIINFSRFYGLVDIRMTKNKLSLRKLSDNCFMNKDRLNVLINTDSDKITLKEYFNICEVLNLNPLEFIEKDFTHNVSDILDNHFQENNDPFK